ncbi:MAG: response regulator transcription factor [Leptospirales bacterium]|nr:response regulator transcription factor [Leptospirales bacterium]
MKQIRVLHIDDEPDLLADIALALGRSGFLVDSALSFSGWRKLLSKAPDVILLDIDMPGKSGFDLLTDLKSRAIFQRIPVLFLTAHSERSTLLRGLREGLDDYITKPCDAEELALRIRAVVNRTGLQDTISAGPATIMALRHLDDLEKSDQTARLDVVLGIFERICNTIQDKASGIPRDRRSSPDPAPQARPATRMPRERRARDLVIFGDSLDPDRLERILRAGNRLLAACGNHILIPEGEYLAQRPFPFLVAAQVQALEKANLADLICSAAKDKLFHA